MDSETLRLLKSALLAQKSEGEGIKLKRLPKLNVGDKVIRFLAGVIPMELEVISVTDELIKCGGKEYPGADWDFDPVYGIEIDEDITKNMPKGMIISYIVPIKQSGDA